jgi:hypothetical protein
LIKDVPEFLPANFRQVLLDTLGYAYLNDIKKLNFKEEIIYFNLEQFSILKFYYEDNPQNFYNFLEE